MEKCKDGYLIGIVRKRINILREKPSISKVTGMEIYTLVGLYNTVNTSL